MRDVNFLRQQTQTFMWTGVALLLLASLLALLLARQLTRPLRRLAAALRRLADGDYNSRVRIDSRDELGLLGGHLNQLTQTLAANEQLRQRWFADVSHELRTPLAIVRGELEALEDGLRPFDRGALRSLQQEVNRLSALVNDLHELSLSDPGALAYRKRPLDLRDVIAQTADAFSARLREHDLSLTLRDEPWPSLRLDGDAGRLRQLFTNLLENAIRYTDPGGRIELSADLTDAGRAVTLRLDDSAPGVAAADRERLFEPLYRTDTARSRVDGGSGLGLAICHNIVAAHGGNVRAEASPLGGLAVVIILELASG